MDGPKDNFDRTLLGFLVPMLAVTVFRIVYLLLDLVPVDGDEALYWTWSLAPDFGYFSKPPMVAWLMRITTMLFGHGSFGLKIASPVVHGCTSLLVFAVGRRMWSSRHGWWAGMVYLLLPGVTFSSALMTTDPPMMMFWALGLWTLSIAIDTNRLGWWVASGGAAGAALLSKYTALAFPASALFFLLASPIDRPRLRTAGPWVAMAAMLLVVSPNIVWNAANGFPTVSHVGDNASLAGASLHPDRALGFLAAQAGVLGPIPWAVLAVLLARWRGSTADRRQLLMLSFVVPLLGTMTIQGLLSKANANWAAPIVVSASVAVAVSLIETRRDRWLKAAVVVNILIATLVYAYEPIIRGLDLTPALRHDLYVKVRGRDDMARLIGQTRTAWPGTLLLFEYQRILVETVYFAGVPIEECFEWNPSGVAHDHTELTRDLEDHVGRDVLFFSRSADVSPLRASFAAIETLTPLRVRSHPDYEYVLHVFLCRGFRGYASREPASFAPEKRKVFGTRVRDNAVSAG